MQFQAGPTSVTLTDLPKHMARSTNARRHRDRTRLTDSSMEVEETTIAEFLEHIQDPDPAHRNGFVDQLPKVYERQLQASGLHGKHALHCQRLRVKPTCRWIRWKLPDLP